MLNQLIHIVCCIVSNHICFKAKLDYFNVFFLFSLLKQFICYFKLIKNIFFILLY